MSLNLLLVNLVHRTSYSVYFAIFQVSENSITISFWSGLEFSPYLSLYKAFLSPFRFSLSPDLFPSPPLPFFSPTSVFPSFLFFCWLFHLPPTLPPHHSASLTSVSNQKLGEVYNWNKHYQIRNWAIRMFPNAKPSSANFPGWGRLSSKYLSSKQQALGSPHRLPDHGFGKLGSLQAGSVPPAFSTFLHQPICNLNDTYWLLWKHPAAHVFLQK